MKYLAYYDNEINKLQQRVYDLAAANKIEYICESINKSGIDVEIISPSLSSVDGFQKGLVYKINEHTSVKLFSTWRAKNILSKILKYLYSWIKLWLFLLIKIEKNETIIVYHSLALINTIHYLTFLKFIKKFNLILQIEEIYGDVINDERRRREEFKIINKGDKFIFSTILLNEVLNKRNKPFLVIHGTYKSVSKVSEKFDDGRIHCVYSGNFMPTKGVGMAVATAEFLDERYHIHILGSGTKDQNDKILQRINLISQRTKCNISYDGVLRGKEYIKFIQSCHIGLSTQNPDSKYNESSFPSKVLSYLSNGLLVVSIRIKALEMSSVSELLYFYDNSTPEEVAKKIMSIELAKYYGSQLFMQKLDKEFTEKIRLLINT